MQYQLLIPNFPGINQTLPNRLTHVSKTQKPYILCQ